MVMGKLMNNDYVASTEGKKEDKQRTKSSNWA